MPNENYKNQNIDAKLKFISSNVLKFIYGTNWFILMKKIFILDGKNYLRCYCHDLPSESCMFSIRVQDWLGRDLGRF